MECVAHIPHKEWSGNLAEQANYEAIEQWSRQLHDASAHGHFTGGTVYVPLLIPSKGWSGSRWELENYLAIERWSRYFQVHCITPPPPTGC